MVKRLYYRIGQACKRLDIQPYVLRYWETEFRTIRAICEGLETLQKAQPSG